MSYKKLIILMITLLPLSCISAESIRVKSVNAYIDGMWGSWKPATVPFGAYVSANGYYNDFVVYPANWHPSYFFIRVRFEGTVPEPNAKERRRRMREDEWYEFKGTIELRWALRWFYEEEEIKDQLSDWQLPISIPVFDGAMKNYSDPIKIPATINIAPYKKRPKCYNIFFDLKSGERFGIGFTL